MHDPKTDNEVQRFEKEVQQKMEELEFSPSAAVWANVALAVKKEKRRRVPAFWLFFLPALLLIGGAGIYFIGGHSGTTLTAKNTPAAPSVVSPAAPSVNSPANRPATTSSNTVPSATNPASESTVSPSLAARSTTPASAGKPAPATTSASDVTNAPSTTSTHTNTRPSPVPGSPAVADHTTQLATAHPDTRNSDNHGLAPHPHRTTGLPSATRPAVEEPGDPSAASVNGSSKFPAATRTSASASPSAPDKTPVPASTTGATSLTANETQIQPAKINFHLGNNNSTPKVIAAPLTTVAVKNTLPKTQLSPKRPWEAGFTGGIGVSSLHQALFKQSASSLNDSRNFAAPAPVRGPVNSSNGAAAPAYSSKIQSDLAFWAGIFVQKPLSRSLSVSVGLNLHYYSTKVYTGEKITSTIAASYAYSPSAYLLSSAAAPGPGQTYPYYTTGDKQAFINRYYFLEIPGSIQWQISHSRVLPLFWEGGFSLSYLMSSNALYYNTKAGVFYKDGDVTNKTQFNLSTALMVGIPFKGVNLQVGPQVQYGLTSLLNTGTGSGQHFFYGGLKVVVFPGKAHKGGKHRFRLQEQ